MRNQTPPPDNAAVEIFRALMASGCGPRELEPTVNMLQQFRTVSPAGSSQVDRLMVEEIGRMRAGLESARASQEGIRQTIEAITAPPFFPATFLARNGT